MLLHTMKLNQRPKVTATPGAGSCCLLLMLLLIINSVHHDHLQLVGAFQAGARSTGPEVDNSSASRANETLAATEVEPNKRLHVNNLRLISDYRAIKLQWSYAHSPSNPPASFNVRYCELTSWNMEIKCRRKELRVIARDIGGSGGAVISGLGTPPAQDVARQLELPDEYAAQIYDLRALTNYTFQVWLGRLAQEPLTRALRRLDESSFEAADESNSLQKRVETKPFSAEATRCLANSSEVLVTTGKYFGGRISVEDSSNPRCILLGNKSSEQTSYLFRIDHEACESKLMNGNRVEAMILVHENKDILTHNTARFLVLCNFHHNSFTLRASVSLPKVHGTGGRPAIISPVSSREAHSVTLGSMPGIFRARSASDPSDSRAPTPSSSIRTTGAEEMESNSIAAGQRGLAGGKELRRVPKELSSLSVPEPVQVQSKLLFVGQPAERLWPSRGRGLTSGRSIMQATAANQISAGHETAPRMLLSAEGSGPRQLSDVAGAASIESPVSSSPGESILTGAGSDSAAELQSAVTPIIITNNHRTVYSEMQNLARSRPSPLGSDEPQDNYSIRYSAAPVNEYNVQSIASTNPLLQAATPLKLRARSGRMRTISGQQQELMLLQQQPVGETPFGVMSSPLLNKMGEVSPPPPEVRSSGGDLQMLDSSQDMSGFVPANASLAHNITSYLLKWSLRTLTNLARKSLESLIVHPNKLSSDNSNSNNNNDTLASISESTYSQVSSSQPGSVSKQQPDSTTATTPAHHRHHHHQSKTTSETRTTVKPVRPLELDGFLISSGTGGGDGKTVASESIARTAQLHHQHLHHHHHQPATSPSPSSSKPSNYSRSLDLSRDDAPVSQQIARSLSRSGWLVYALLLVTALALAAFFGLCIVFGRPRKRNLRAAHLAQANSMEPQHDPPVVGGLAGICNPILDDIGDTATIGDQTYQRYDYNKFDSDTINKRALLAEEKSKLRTNGHSHLRHHHPSPPVSFRNSTRSTSLNEDENDCKNNEFFYTEHVLINTETNFGESYA